MRRTGSVSVFWNIIIYRRSRNGVAPYFFVVIFIWFFRSLLVHATSLPRTSSLTLSFLVDAGCCVGVAASFDEDVRDVGGDELEELVDRPGTTNGT